MTFMGSGWVGQRASPEQDWGSGCKNYIHCVVLLGAIRCFDQYPRISQGVQSLFVDPVLVRGLLQGWTFGFQTYHGAMNWQKVNLYLAGCVQIADILGIPEYIPTIFTQHAYLEARFEIRPSRLLRWNAFTQCLQQR